MSKKKNEILKIIYFNLVNIGFDPLKFFAFIRGFFPFVYDLINFYKNLPKGYKFIIRPVYFDKYDKSGILKGHYFHQDLHVAKKIFVNGPKSHLDIGSRTDGFVAHVACFMKIDILDIREQNSKIENISFKKADLMDFNPTEFNKYPSISCLHAIEHFGLGRYGDPINISGHEIALDNIYKLLEPNGKFYFSTVFGEMRVEFNTHRVFNLKYLVGLLEKKFLIKNFSYVDDLGDLHEDVQLEFDLVENNFYQNYGCAIFELEIK
jgi:hypothetical protein